MKIWVWTVFVGVLTFILLSLLNLPYWIFLVAVVPLLIIALIFGSFSYSFRESLKIEEIPARGYGLRVNGLNRAAREIEVIGFHKIDQFYLKMIPDSVTYVFKHQDEPVYFCLYHLGKKHVCDFVTRYEGGFYLTTSDTVDAGMAPRPEKALLQIFPAKSYDVLLSKHRDAHTFILNNGIRTYDIPEEEFRHDFMQSLREQSAYIRIFFLWPVMLLLRTVVRKGKIFCRSIPEQHPQGLSKIGLPGP